MLIPIPGTLFVQPASQQEIDAQRSLSLITLQPQTPTRSAFSNNELLDMENNVVVEILTDEEFMSLEKWWPEVSSSFALRFSVNGQEISWSTLPCRQCDASSDNYELSIRHSGRTKKAASLKKAPAASLEY